MPVHDLTGKKYNKLTVLKRGNDRISESGRKFITWECICECGNIITVDANNLRNNNTKSCGCITNCKDLTGQIFGDLKVIKRMENNSRGDSKWLCECTCGNTKVILRNSLISGRTKSCGCGMLAALEKGRYSMRTHGMSKSRLYGIWCGIKKRTSESADVRHKKDYFEREIRVCEEWADSFEKFQEWALENGYNDKLTIDRINNDGNYEPKNCRWADNKTQANNKRSNRVYEYKGEKLNISQLSEKYNINYSLLRERLSVLKWDIEKAIEAPSMKEGD